MIGAICSSSMRISQVETLAGPAECGEQCFVSKLQRGHHRVASAHFRGACHESPNCLDEHFP